MFSKFQVSKYQSLLIAMSLFFVLLLAISIINFFVQRNIVGSLNYVSVVNELGSDHLPSQSALRSDFLEKSAQGRSFTLSDGRKVSMPTKMQEQTSAFAQALKQLDSSQAKLAKSQLDAEQQYQSIQQQLTQTTSEIELAKQGVLEDSVALDDLALVLMAAQSQAADDFSAVEQALNTAEKSAEIEMAAIKASLQNSQQLANKQYKSKSQLALSFMAIGIIFSILLYFLLLTIIFKRLGESEKVSESTKNETANIMATVSEGLFLIGRDNTIGIEQSESLKKMFSTEKDLEGDFFQFIGQYVVPSDVENARDFIEILFGERVKERLIEGLNPLTEVKVHITRPDGSVEDRYLGFKFKRVFENDKLAYLLVSTTDISKEVMLRKELEDTKEKQDSQIDLLMSILHVNSDSLSKFFLATETALNVVNDMLKNSAQTGFEMKNNINTIFRHMHKVKGDAASLKLYNFEALAHEVESGLDELKSKVKIDGSDLLPFTSQLKDMFNELNNMQALVEKVSGISRNSNSPAVEDAPDTSLHNLQSLVQNLSQRLNKPAQVNLYGMDEASIPDELENAVSDISVQLVRNSLAHGIESAESRLEKKKSSVAQILVSFKDIGEKGYELIVQDDGQGIDEEKVLNKAIEKNLISEESSKKITTSNQFAKLIFSPGFSTQDESDMDSGRGVGLDLVRNTIKQNKAKMGVNYKKDSYCRFRVVFPKAA